MRENIFAQHISNQELVSGTGAQGWCTGMTLRDGMGRAVGGGFRMGNTCKSMTDSDRKSVV